MSRVRSPAARPHKISGDCPRQKEGPRKQQLPGALFLVERIKELEALPAVPGGLLL